MDSGRKRKASNATPSTSDGTIAKRIKLLNSNGPDVSDGQNQVQKVGNKLMGMLHNAQDKYGRSIADAFLTLPSRSDLPDYYQVIRLPVAIDTIEAKLRRNAYPTITTLESDLKRMVQNAKDYNQPKSDVYEDAERIRKLVYNYMKVQNPQYQLDPTYSSFPTPIPKENGQPAKDTAPPEPSKPEYDRRDSNARSHRSTAPKVSEPPSERQTSTVPSGADGDEATDVDFTGKTFQEAQQMILSECIQFADDEGLEIFTPFVNLPSRKLEDYYRLIKRPVSLRSVQKRARGQHGRNPPTGHTDFKTWDAFEEEISFIWRNAKEYNEDGSDMYNLAGDFEEHFRALLIEAKEKVDEPAGTRIKIGAPKPKSGITLNLTQHKGSPTPGVTVDNEALARQRQMVQAGVNGRQTDSHAPPPVNGTAQVNGQHTAMEVTRLTNHVVSAGATATASPGPMVKHERTTTQSPAPHSTSTQTVNGTMAPPMTAPPSASPHPAPPSVPTVNSFHYTAPALLPPTPLRTYPLSQALLPVVTIATHPQLKVSRPCHLKLTPHVSLSHQSSTITLPPSQYYLQIAPTISKELSMGRAYKLFVTVNGSRLTQRDTQFHVDSGKRTHVYEGSLAQGVNRIEVEVVAAKPDVNGDGKGLDIEKVTVFANLMRS